MTRRATGKQSRPILVKFNRTKYGRELQIDAAWVRHMPGFISDASRHILAFHELLLITRGHGTLLLDGERIAVAPGVIIFCLPGQQREWQIDGRLDGASLFFAEDFITDAFADGRFLERFAYFRATRCSAAANLDAGEQRLFRARFAAMHSELVTLRADASHRLRAALYELLVLIDRWYKKAHGAPADTPLSTHVERFQRLVDRDFRSRHRVRDYARELGCTPGYLSHLCRVRIRCNAGGMIRRRIVLEARRLLLHTGLSAAQIAQQLGFDDAAYFSRFLRRETGLVPSRLRAAHGAGGESNERVRA